VPEVPALDSEVRRALEGLWSSAAIPGSAGMANRFRCAGHGCLDLDASPNEVKRRVFQINIKDFMDAYTFNVKQLMKCCVAVLVPDGRLIPFCAYNTLGYREQVREQLRRRRRGAAGTDAPSRADDR
jgi:hypothetical protein